MNTLSRSSVLLAIFVLAFVSSTSEAAVQRAKKVRGVDHTSRHQARSLEEVEEPTMAPTAKKDKEKVVCVYDEDGLLIEEQDVMMSRTTEEAKKKKECKSKKPPPKKDPTDEADVQFIAENVYEDEDGNLVMEGRMGEITPEEEIAEETASASYPNSIYGGVVAALGSILFNIAF